MSPACPNQDVLENALVTGNNLSQTEREDTIKWMRQAGGPNGIDKYLQKYNVDVIIGPADCECTEPPAAAGKLALLRVIFLQANSQRLPSGHDASFNS